MPITTRLGKNSKRRNVQRSSRNVERTIILMGLLTGNKNDAVSAIKVHAKRKGSTGRRRRVTNVYTIGVRISAVASFERIIEIRLPKIKVLSNKRRGLPPARLAALAANQSNKPAASARADKDIMPRKKKKMFQSLRSTVSASSGLISPRMRRSNAPASAIRASSHL